MTQETQIKMPEIRKTENLSVREKINNAINIPLFLEKSKSFFFDQPVIEALARLVLKLKENITTYDTILSDDASGRLVSLLLKKIIDKQKKKIGKKGLPIYFLASGRHRTSQQVEALKEFIKSKKDKLGKTLLVTEYISAGEGITYLVKILKEEGINFDVATVSIKYNPDKHKFYDQDLVTRLKYGLARDKSGMNSLYGKVIYSGVRKSQHINTAHPILAKNRSTVLMKQVRQDIDVLAKKLSKLLD